MRIHESDDDDNASTPCAAVVVVVVLSRLFLYSYSTPRQRTIKRWAPDYYYYYRTRKKNENHNTDTQKKEEKEEEAALVAEAVEEKVVEQDHQQRRLLVALEKSNKGVFCLSFLLFFLGKPERNKSNTFLENDHSRHRKHEREIYYRLKGKRNRSESCPA